MIYHLNFSYYEKKSKFQVKFHVFCKFKKKAWFIPIRANRVGLRGIWKTEEQYISSPDIPKTTQVTSIG